MQHGDQVEVGADRVDRSVPAKPARKGQIPITPVAAAPADRMVAHPRPEQPQPRALAAWEEQAPGARGVVPRTVPQPWTLAEAVAAGAMPAPETAAPGRPTRRQHGALLLGSAPGAAEAALQAAEFATVAMADRLVEAEAEAPPMPEAAAPGAPGARASSS